MKKVLLRYLFLILLIFNSCNKDNSEIELEKIAEITGPFVTLNEYITLKNDGDFDKYFGHDSLKGKYIDLNGSLYITGDLVTNLEKLKNLHSVSGGFGINSRSIKSLKGLESLTHIGDHFSIYNTECVDLTGLLRLKEVGETFEIVSNSSVSANIGLNSLSGLESIKKIGGYFILKGNERLESLEGIESLEEIGGNLSLNDNPLLSKMDKLNSLKSISGIELLDLPSLETLSFIPGLNSIDHLLIQNCNKLSNLKGIESIQEIKSISLVSDKNLEQINDLENTEWASLYFSGNDKLISLDGLSSSVAVENVYLQENHALQNLNGLSNLQMISGTLYLEYNGIVNIEGLKKVKNIGSISINEQNLTDVIFPELESVNTINIANRYDTISIPNLNVNKLVELDLFGCNLSVLYLPGISEILNLSIQECSFINKGNFPVLNRIDNFKVTNCGFFNGVMFPELESVNNLEFVFNKNQDFSWMPKLKSADKIEINNNLLVKSLSGLESLNWVSLYMNILNNTNLKDFCPLKKLAESNPSININISGNGENPSLNDILNCGE